MSLKSWKWNHQRSSKCFIENDDFSWNLLIFGDLWLLLVIFHDKIWSFIMINHHWSWQVTIRLEEVALAIFTSMTVPVSHYPCKHTSIRYQTNHTHSHGWMDTQTITNFRFALLLASLCETIIWIPLHWLVTSTFLLWKHFLLDPWDIDVMLDFHSTTFLSR